MDNTNKGPKVFNFEELIKQETDVLDGPKGPHTNRFSTDNKNQEPNKGEDREPWVKFTTADRFGLALSGGGIRSATFNLGVLQELNTKKMLKPVDYMSTVSGGGYVGGFWTAWLKRTEGCPDFFPINHPDSREANEIRHLREFSNFLIPRLGFLSGDMWAGVMAIISGAIPAFIFACSVMILAIFIWAIFAGLIFGTSLPMRIIGISLITCLTWSVLWWAEKRWQKMGNMPGKTDKTYTVASFFATVLIALIWIARFYSPRLGAIPPGHLIPLPANYTDFISGFNSVVFEPVIVWGALTLLLIFLRVIEFQIPKSSVVDPFNRIATRLFALAVFWCVMGLVWEAAVFVYKRGYAWIPGIAAISAGGVFISLQKWLMLQPSKARAGGFVSWLKPILPQIAANVAVFLLAVVLLTMIFDSWGSKANKILTCLACWLAAAVVAFAFGFFVYDPHRVGLHDFYRSRICRAYLGASNTKGAAGKDHGNRMADEQPGDDLFITSLIRRPLHLVCCTANCLSGDPLQTLYRGGLSAVVSPLAISLGNSARESEDVQLSTALTASAAAFNSNMGSISMRLGPAVTFLMSALNLRLGLWRPNPAAKVSDGKHPPATRARFPGTYLLREMFQQTNTNSTYIHLSDGGHFENLGLYELIRRHCRYVIVCDASADPDVAFDDIGNALRRVREDFGVQIEINLEPLRPDANQMSKQHVAIGTIHYDQIGGMDKGIIIYLKPTLTGDEPYDVQQYRSRNHSFPHESTGEQFYDEAQWESYRRLGQHCIETAFRFVERMPKDDQNRLERIFGQARQEWYPGFEGLETKFLELTKRCSALEGQIRDKAPERLRREFFPEVSASMADFRWRRRNGNVVEDTDKVIFYLLQVIKLMEEVWVGCRLDEHWTHPLNLGWVSYMRRWASIESLRRWWPILAPTCSAGFQRFAAEHLKLRYEDVKFKLDEFDPNRQQGLAWRTWQRRPANDRKTFDLSLILRDRTGEKRLQVAVVSAQIEGDEISWKSSDLYILPSLRRAKIAGIFLDQLIEYLGRQVDATCIIVHLSGTGKTGLADRQFLAERIALYKGRGFAYATSRDGDGKGPYLRLNLSNKGQRQAQEPAGNVR